VERNYKNLNLDRSLIQGVTESFAESHQYAIESIGDMPGTQNGVRVVFGQAGNPFATVNIFFNKDGTSTLQFATGANQQLGKLLVDQLYDSINPAEFEQVNLVLQGFIEATITPVLELTSEQSHLVISESFRDTNKVIWKIKSEEYQDELTITLHIKSRKLQIQGRPLSCYRAFIFNVTELLDLQGLEKVLIRQEDGKAEIVQQEVARTHLRAVLGDSYENLHQSVEKLLISGLCVKLAAPDMPDYCLLLYPELRSIEGILKQKMQNLGMEVGREGFKDFFVKNQANFYLDAQYEQLCPNQQVVQVLSDAYTFFNRERHGLFHMEALVDASRMMGNISHLMTKSTQAWELIKRLYSF
jgi:hypothetical protein